LKTSAMAVRKDSPRRARIEFRDRVDLPSARTLPVTNVSLGKVNACLQAAQQRLDEAARG
ncbi:MAG: hypothetical protein M3P10_00575, partial [Actinomycetota bacterium]|nr:hypothetical protein [Actinomycetota bacterium]